MNDIEKKSMHELARKAVSRLRSNRKVDNSHLLDTQGRVRVGMGLARLSHEDRMKWLAKQNETTIEQEKLD